MTARYLSIYGTAEYRMYKKEEKEKELFYLVYMIRGKKSLLVFFRFFCSVRRKKSKRRKKDFLFLSLLSAVVLFSDITCSHLIASSDRLVWIRVIIVHITLSTNETYPVVGIKINSTRGNKTVVMGASIIVIFSDQQ